MAERTALEGVTLIDFGQYLAGPFGPMIIGDLGADVIKVEPVTGDGMRFVNQPFTGCQRGKRDISLNLKTEAGLKVALELVERADIVHHNMTVGVADRLGIGYDACKAVNPDVVYCNTYAYGLEGPLARFGGLDPLFQATAGLEYENAPVHAGNPPMYYRFGMCDTANAMLSVLGCLAALYHQRRTGEGQELWTSLLDGGQMLASDALLVDGARAPVPQLDANGMVATIEDPELGTTTQVGMPIHLMGTPGAIRGPRPSPGQHNEEILGELGYSPEAMKAFT